MPTTATALKTTNPPVVDLFSTEFSEPQQQQLQPKQQQNVDLFFDHFASISTNNNNTSSTINPTSSKTNDLFEAFGSINSSSTNATLNPIPSSFTMPNINSASNNNNNLNDLDLFGSLSTTSSIIQPAPVLSNSSKTNQITVNPARPPSTTSTNTMWDSLGKSVDINLDNLSPYSKGAKNTPVNLPMNHLINNNSNPSQKTSPPLVKQASLISPPISTGSFNFSSPQTSPKQQQQFQPQVPLDSSNKNNNNMSLLDF
jgi:hypothetical protein